MPLPDSRVVACLDYKRGPRYAEYDKNSACSAGWKARSRKLGCFFGKRILAKGALSDEMNDPADCLGLGIEKGITIPIFNPPVKRYLCPVHGDVGEYHMGMIVTASGEKLAEWCVYCMIEKFDAIGIQRVIEEKL